MGGFTSIWNFLRARDHGNAHHEGSLGGDAAANMPFLKRIVILRFSCNTKYLKAWIRPGQASPDDEDEEDPDISATGD